MVDVLEQRLKASAFLCMLPLDEQWTFVSHSVLGNRRLFTRDSTLFLAGFIEPHTAFEVMEAAIERGVFVRPHPDRVEDWHRRVRIFMAELMAARLVVPPDQDEAAVVAADAKQRWTADPTKSMALGAMEDVFAPVVPMTMDADAPVPHASLSFLLLGWCFTQSIGPVLQVMGRQRGWDIKATAAFHDDTPLMEQMKPDVTVLQLSHRMVLAPLLDGFAQAPTAEREARVQAACQWVTHTVEDALARVGTGLLLLQGIALPQTSPLGIREHREPLGMFEALRRINQHAAKAVAQQAHALFVDEDQILSNLGKRILLDDLVSTYSHHGALASDPARPENFDRMKSFGATDKHAIHKALAQAYLDLAQAWRAERAIRLVCVDLDNTLWPGNVGDEGFTFDSDDVALALMYGREAGLHEALKILKDRGILLAVVSRNSAEQVLDKWKVEQIPLVYQAETRDTRHQLRPDDFVRLKISWGPKSQAVRELMDELGVTPQQVCFIDDHPVERAEVRNAFPDVMVLGEDMHRVREALLTNPRFELLKVSTEARQRTASTQARLQRDDALAAAPDPQAFLRSLNVRVRLERIRDTQHLPRVVELLARTNQFNTSLRRFTLEEVTSFLQRPDADIFTMTVQDRFGDYGLVGAAVVQGTELSVFAMSCRVLGLEAERALLSVCMRAAQQRGPSMTVPFVNNQDRNLPATRLFRVPGFERLANGAWLFAFNGPIPALPQHLTLVD